MRAGDLYKYVFFSLLLVLASCNPTTDEGYRPLDMFDGDIGIEISSSPANIVPNQPNLILLGVRPLFSGKGYFFVVGHGGGQPIGQIVHPINEELGSVSFPVTFERGEFAECSWLFQVAQGYTHVGMSLQAAYDSLLIDGIQYPINSPESKNLIGLDALYSISAHMTLDAEKQ